MVVSVLSMVKFAQSKQGYEILEEARESLARTVVTRVPPFQPEDDPEGTFVVMFLDWEQGLIIHLITEPKEFREFLKIANKLSSENILDSFNVKGETVQ